VAPAALPDARWFRDEQQGSRPPLGTPRGVVPVRGAHITEPRSLRWVGARYHASRGAAGNHLVGRALLAHACQAPGVLPVGGRWFCPLVAVGLPGVTWLGASPRMSRSLWELGDGPGWCDRIGSGLTRPDRWSWLVDFVEGDGFVTARAVTAVADATPERAAVGTVLVAELAGSAGVALIDGGGPARSGGRGGRWGGVGLVAAPPPGLATRWRTPRPGPGAGGQPSAARLTRCRYGNVTRRHGVLRGR
jgi:hypothetical protein